MNTWAITFENFYVQHAQRYMVFSLRFQQAVSRDLAASANCTLSLSPAACQCPSSLGNPLTHLLNPPVPNYPALLPLSLVSCPVFGFVSYCPSLFLLPACV